MDDEPEVGPSISAKYEEPTAEEPPAKKIKETPFDHLYLENLPNSESYEKSYMHRDMVSHLVVTKTEFLITASVDGHVKFWKKKDEGIEFVKHFRSHLQPITSLSANANGTYLCTSSLDKTAKIFDVLNFDMINMIKLDFVPNCTEWIVHADAIFALAISDKDSGKINVFDSQGSKTPLHVFERMHSSPVVAMKYNPVYDVVVSVDKSGILEYWHGPKNDYKFPAKTVLFESKLDTSLFEFAKNKTTVTSIAFTRDGKKFGTLSTDRKVRIFSFLKGKLLKVIDESLSRFVELQHKSQATLKVDSGRQREMDKPDSFLFGRRMATEKELEKTDSFLNGNVLFDYSGHFILYSTMLGIKIVNIDTNKCVNIIGKSDNLRPIQIALYQERARKTKAAVTLQQEASENPTLESALNDPTIFCTAFKKQRFYLYSRRLPSDIQDVDRDVFNEKPSKEDIISVAGNQELQKIFDQAIIHTTMGDIHMKLFGKDCPKTVENFCVHSKNGYYNSHIFHRVIKGFMIQTGDPTGTGSGGESIWGSDFKDEFAPTLKHDRPYTVSMANAGPNSNGSQFFITVLPTPWLDMKHTVFGRVFKGMEVVQNICNAKTNPKTDKPYDDIKIISIHLS